MQAAQRPRMSIHHVDDNILIIHRKLLKKRKKLLGVTFSIVLISFILSLITFICTVIGIADKSRQYYAFFEEPTFFLDATAGVSMAISLIMTFDWEWNVFHGGSFKQNRTTELWRGGTAGVLSFISATISLFLYSFIWAWIPGLFILTGVLQMTYGVLVWKWYMSLDRPIERRSGSEFTVAMGRRKSMRMRKSRARGMSASSQAIKVENNQDSGSEAISAQFNPTVTISVQDEEEDQTKNQQPP